MADSQDRADAEQGTERARACVLIVDDDRWSLNVLGELLSAHYDVLAASSGKQALAIAAGAIKPVLILLDVLMPDMDGYAVLARLLANPGTRDIPVIFLTGLDSSADEERGLEQGAVDYLTKPLRPRIVLARVRAQIELKRARDFEKEQAARLEREVVRRGDMLQAITNAAQDAIIMIDGEGLVAFWNHAAERIFGYAAEEVLGRALHSLLAPTRYHDACAKGFSGFRNNGEGNAVGKVLELQAMRKDGTEFPVEISLASIRWNEGWWGIGVVRDVTERKCIEAQMRGQLAELTQANTELKALNIMLSQAQSQLLQSEKMASLGVLAAGVAHEINNPIAYVNSNLGTLKEYVSRLLEVLGAYEQAEQALPVDSSAFSALKEAKAQADLGYLKEDIVPLVDESRVGLERVRKIVQDLKNFSRMDVEESWKEADLQQEIESTLNVVWNELKYRCDVRREYGDIPPVDCLPSQLNQVFMNILVNAGQSIEHHGVITIRTGCEGNDVWVEIADTGKGMTPETISRIFDPFFTTKPVGVGTGLGLSVSYRIVEKHRGRIEVTSEVGVGTVFRVWLPVKRPPAS